MSYALMVIVYGALAVFAIAVLARAIRIKSYPLHVRWEIYPVAHEKGRASYGGSFMEQTDWWKKPREVDVLGEIRYMVPEILFLVALKENNPKLWISSFPFHFGIYLLAGGAAFIVGGAVFQAVTGEALAAGMSSLPGTILYWAAAAFWIAGIALVVAGALGLLVRRLTDEDLKPYTTPGHLVNLVMFLATMGVATWHLLAFDMEPLLGGLRGVVQGLVTFKVGEVTPVLFGHVALLAVLLAWIPLTHMSHFFTKWFLYHSIRWDDEPNLKGGKYEAEINELLRSPVSWSAPHIRGEGKKNWLDIATENPARPKEEEKA